MKPNFIIAVTGQSNSQGVGGYYDISKSEDQLVKYLDEYIKKETALY